MSSQMGIFFFLIRRNEFLSSLMENWTVFEIGPSQLQVHVGLNIYLCPNVQSTPT